MKEIVLSALLISSLCSGIDGNVAPTTLAQLGHKIRQATLESPVAFKICILMIFAQSGCVGIKEFLLNSFNKEG